MKQKKLTIPARFQLMGQTFHVELHDSPVNSKGAKINGIVYHNGCNMLFLRTVSSRFPRDQQERTFLHELIHAVAKVTGHEKEIYDEEVIDALAYGLHQALTLQSDDPAPEIDNKAPEEVTSSFEGV
jgi:hypothetical protein